MRIGSSQITISNKSWFSGNDSLPISMVILVDSSSSRFRILFTELRLTRKLESLSIRGFFWRTILDLIRAVVKQRGLHVDTKYLTLSRSTNQGSFRDWEPNESKPRFIVSLKNIFLRKQNHKHYKHGNFGLMECLWRYNTILKHREFPRAYRGYWIIQCQGQPSRCISLFHAEYRGGPNCAEFYTVKIN